MRLQIHDDARLNYNKLADELVSRLRPAPDALRPKSRLPDPNIHVAHQFTPADLIGEMAYGWTDVAGNIAARAFGQKGQMIGLFDEDHEA